MVEICIKGNHFPHLQASRAHGCAVFAHHRAVGGPHPDPACSSCSRCTGRATGWWRWPTAPERQRWSEEASTALQYLEGRADRMRYPTYKARGWPIGSGQHVIGARIKRSGMPWSRPGASQMATLRLRAVPGAKWPIFIPLATKSRIFEMHPHWIVFCYGT